MGHFSGRRPTPALLLCGWLFSSACYTHRPAELTTVLAGERVQVEVTRIGFASLPELLGTPGPELGGTLVERSSSQILLRVPVRIRDGSPVPRVIDRDVSIPVDQIVVTRRRELNRPRTALAIVGGLATLGAAFLGFKAATDRAPERPEVPPDEEAGVGMTASMFWGLTLLRIVPP